MLRAPYKSDVALELVDVDVDAGELEPAYKSEAVSVARYPAVHRRSRRLPLPRPAPAGLACPRTLPSMPGLT